MPQTLSLADATAQLVQLVERAAAGEEIIIAKAGRPVARLGPISPTPLRTPGLLKGMIRIGPNFDADLPEALTAAFAGKTE